jgi:poly(3-hydroxybutyrate) depolymerase
MADEGFAYVPTGCEKAISVCRIHVNYHGCLLGYQGGVLKIAQHSGFIEWAESNSIVIIFPQANASVNAGCWDWDGSVVGPLFDTKQGGQLQTVLAMVSDLQNAIPHTDKQAIADW